MSRHAGLMLPISAAPSRRSWGIGELPDLVHLSTWMRSAGFSRLMILPIGIVAGGDTSPYSSLSSMGIDPAYISLDDVPEFERSGGLEALDAGLQADLDTARASTRLDYARVRRVKQAALDLAFDTFMTLEWQQLTTRASELAGFISRERWWLDDLALYQAIAGSSGQARWLDWPAPLRDRDPGAIDEARRSLAREVLRQQYLQWIAESQWQQARAEARRAGVEVFGDLQFMVSGNGPEVWCRPDEVMFDVSLGVPPDAFSDRGQDWGLPTYNWDRIAQTGDSWMRQRARRMAAVYDGYRVDHLVGFYRTFGRPAAGEPFFNPRGEAAQTAQGERLLRIFQEAGMPIIAEDLGLVPDFVRASMARLDVPGCKVLRWERHWRAPGAPFIDPREYPVRSAALSATHDTTTLAEWWREAQPDDRRGLAMLIDTIGGPRVDPAGGWTLDLADAVLGALYHSASADMFVLMQDVFGWTDRINEPGTISDRNWTWRLPWNVDDLPRVPEAAARARDLAALSRASGRLRGLVVASTRS